MKVKKMENFQNKMGLKECKWSSLNAPDTENPMSHALMGFGIHSTYAFAAKIKRSVSEQKVS